MERNKVISMFRRKGGSFSSTTAINFAAWLSIFAKMKVLYIDADSQDTCYNCLKIDKSKVSKTLYDLLVDENVKAEEVIYHDDNLLFDIIPSDERLSNIDLIIGAKYEREKQLVYKLDEIKNQYDFIITDGGPSLSLATINILVAADYVLVPLLCDYLSLAASKTTIEDIEKIKKHLNPKIEILGFIISGFDNRRVNDNIILDSFKKQYGNKVFDTTIRQSVRVKEAVMLKLSIFQYDSSSLVYHDLYNLYLEIWKRLGGKINDKTG